MKYAIVLKLEEYDEKRTREAMKFASRFDGVQIVSINRENMELTVIADIDPINIVIALRKRFPAVLLLVGPVKEPAMKKEDGKKDEILVFKKTEKKKITNHPNLEDEEYDEKKIVLKLEDKEYDGKRTREAMKFVCGLDGIQSVSINRENMVLTVIADIGPMRIVTALGKRFPAVLLSVGPAKEPAMKKEDGKKVKSVFNTSAPNTMSSTPVTQTPSTPAPGAVATTTNPQTQPTFVSGSTPTQYDVFLSFHGDTRLNFTGHLYQRLHDHGINTFKDDPKLRRGEVISDALLDAIRNSKAYIVVFSENYANSPWCLDELAEILSCHKTMQRRVIPVFFNIDPSVVRHQTGSFQKGFEKHHNRFRDEREKLKNWQFTLQEVAEFSGLHISKDWSEADAISEIVDELILEIIPKTLDVAKYPLGLDYRVEAITRMLSSDTKSSRPFDDPEVSIKSSSAFIKNILEIQLKFNDIRGVVFDFLKFLGLMEKVLGYELPKSELVAIMNLKVIHIRNSILPEIPYNLSYPNVEMLILRSHLDLSNIPSFFERMPTLKVLDISNTSIRTLPSWVYKFTKLEVLIVQHCELLMELTQEIGALRNLKIFDLSGCTKLFKIPESIDIPQSLSFLFLTDCKSLTKLPESICKLRSLRNMNLSGCTNLVEIPESIEFLEGLSSLDLTDCKSLRKLPESTCNMRSLKCLYLSGCSSLFEVQTGWNDPESPTQLHVPKLLINTLSTTRKADTYIPSFFELMPALKVLDMSHTSIKTLPYWVYQLTKLEELILRYCELLIELPHEVSALKNLKVLDLEGTDLVCLPEELNKLIELKCLKFSLYDAESYRKNKDIVAIIPRKTLSKLTQLEELSINVDPHEVWCGAAMEAVMEDLPSLKKLKLLKLYLPTTKLLQDLLELKGENGLHIYQNLSDFTFVIGPHARHFISRLPCDLEEDFLKLKKCLKYINGEDSTPKLAEALKHANALYLDRHWTLQKLSVFKFEDLIELKFCLLVDCNEMQTLFDGSDFNLGIVNNEDKLLSLQYLAIHYLRKLEVIWKGPGVGCCLHSLKLLVVHTCPNLTTIFTPVLLEYLVNLREIEVEGCPKIKTLVAEDQSHLKSKEILPRLKKLSLLYLPELVSMFDGFSIGPELENIVIYDCPKLERLPSVGVCNKEMIEVKGESEWWNALEWNESELSGGRPYCLRAFSESETDEDLQDELAPRYGNTLHLLVKDCNST